MTKKKTLRRLLVLGAFVAVFSGPLGGVAHADFDWENASVAASADHPTAPTDQQLITPMDFDWE